jgi:hypothetical protein
VRRAYAVLAVLIAAAIVVPAAQAAKTYRFKADVTVRQLVGWNQHFRDQAWCGDDYHRDFQGRGSGEIKARVRGARITFRPRRGYLESTEVRVPATAGALSDWAVSWVGTPEDCPPDLPAAEPPDTSGCGPNKRGRLDASLIVIGGRLGLLGAFDPAGADDPVPCPDPTALSGVVSPAGAARRRNVDDLIRNRRVRSIELGASVKNKALGPEDMSLAGGGLSMLSAGGDYDAMWSVKLTRVYP